MVFSLKEPSEPTGVMPTVPFLAVHGRKARLDPTICEGEIERSFSNLIISLS